MITDEYTREYDEREKARKVINKLNHIGKIAQKLGLTMSLLDTSKRTTIKLFFPNGEKFLEFRKLDNAVAWANKWS